MVQTYNITIEGYWRDKFKHGVPLYPGIYFVYETKYNPGNDTVALLKLLYVGGAVSNIRERIAGHQLYGEWKKYLREGHELSFSAANTDPGNITRIKAAFIIKLQPPVNRDFKDKFSFDSTTILSSGKTNLIDTNFTVTGD